MITALMKHSRFFYVKSSGNQQMRLSSTQIQMQYHQINVMDSIKNNNNKKNTPLGFYVEVINVAGFVFFFFLICQGFFVLFCFFNRHFWLLHCM